MKFDAGPFLPVIFLIKYLITNWFRYYSNFLLFRSSLEFIINMILFVFLLQFLIFCTIASLDKILEQSVSPIAMWHILHWAYTVTSSICDVMGFPHGFSVLTVLYISPLLPFRFIQHHLSIPVLSITDSVNHNENLSKSNITVPPSCILSFHSKKLYVSTAWRASFWSKKFCQMNLMV